MERQNAPSSSLRLMMLGLLLATTGSPWSALGDLDHDLFICASMTKDFTIGKKTTRNSGLFLLEDRTIPRHIGFNHPRQDAVAFDPRDHMAIFTAGLNGVLRSLDGGENWRIMTGWSMTEPKDIAIDPSAPDHVYIALPDGIGVSLDRGETWMRKDSGIARKYAQSIVVDRTAAGRLIAGTEKGIFLSENGAESWIQVQPTEATVTDVDQSPLDPNVFLATTQEDGVLISRDGARSWSRIGGLTTEHTVHNGDFDAADPNRLAVCGWGLGVRVSEDGGKTWLDRSDGLPNPNIWRVAIDPDIPGRLYCSPHQSAVFVSDDYGLTWKTGFFTEAVVWDFVFLGRD